VHRRVDSVKIAPKGTGCEVTDCIYGAPDMDKWQALLNMVMKFKFP
jgi:hypothetical protein